MIFNNRNNTIYTISSARVDSIVDLILGVLGDDIIATYKDCLPSDNMKKIDKLKHIICCNPRLFHYPKVVLVSLLMLGDGTNIIKTGENDLHTIIEELEKTNKEVLDNFISLYKKYVELPEFMLEYDSAYTLSGLHYIRAKNRKAIMTLDDFVAGMLEFIREVG